MHDCVEVRSLTQQKEILTKQKQRYHVVLLPLLLVVSGLREQKSRCSPKAASFQCLLEVVSYLPSPVALPERAVASAAIAVTLKDKNHSWDRAVSCYNRVTYVPFGVFKEKKTQCNRLLPII